MILILVVPAIQYTMAGIYLLLILATLIIYILSRNPEKDRTELKLRIQSWWMIVFLFSFAILGNEVTAICFVGLISFLAFKEYISLIPTRRADRQILFWLYLSIPLQFYFIYIHWYTMFYVFVPVYMFLFIPLRMVVFGETKGFLRAVGTLQWGLMITVFSLGHLAAIVTFSPKDPYQTGGTGLLLFVMMLTQLNDVAQFCWGKTLGTHKIVPTVSPKKTWEGFLGGMGTIVVLSFLLAPYLTPFSTFHSICLGFIINIGGFFGDTVIGLLKRDLGIKDSGTIIPGHGGILDRVNSLTYTAPLFFHFTNYFYY